LLERVRPSDRVFGDETSIKVLGSTKRAYVWTFIAGSLIAYRFSVDRSGETPQRVLGGSMCASRSAVGLAQAMPNASRARNWGQLCMVPYCGAFASAPMTPEAPIRSSMEKACVAKSDVVEVRGGEPPDSWCELGQAAHGPPCARFVDQEGRARASS
jgi:hypothetical protein